MRRAAEFSTAGPEGKHLSSMRLSIPTLWKRSRHLRKAFWQNSKLMRTLHTISQAGRRWMQGLETKEEFRNTVSFWVSCLRVGTKAEVEGHDNELLVLQEQFKKKCRKCVATAGISKSRYRLARCTLYALGLCLHYHGLPGPCA